MIQNDLTVFSYELFFECPECRKVIGFGKKATDSRGIQQEIDLPELEKMFCQYCGFHYSITINLEKAKKNHHPG
jgi:ribosomal protein L44E